MPVTILGQHISCIRPSLIPKCNVYKSDRPYHRYRIRPRIITHSPKQQRELCELYERSFVLRAVVEVLERYERSLKI